MKIIIIIFIILAILVALYLFGKKMASKEVLNLANTKQETINGVLTLDNVIALFKAQNLNQASDQPFISKRLSGLKYTPEGVLDKPSFQSLVVGVNYNSEPKIIKIIFARSFDDKLNSIFEGKDLVVLQ